MSNMRLKTRLAWIAPLFLLLVVVFTFPLILNLGVSIPGFFSTDESYGLVWDSWRIKHAFLNKMSLTQTDYIAYPFGRQIYDSGYFAGLWLSWHHFLSICTTPVFTYNIQALLNLFFSALFMYLLVLFVAKSYPGALLSGIIFAFCPYQFARIWQHLGLSYNQWLPLVLLAAIFLRERLSRKAEIFLFFSLVVAFSFEWSVMYFCALALAAWVAYSLADFKNDFSGESKFIKKLFLVGLAAFIVLSFQFFRLVQFKLKAPLNDSPSAFNIYHRPFEDLFSQSARPLSYFLPATSHPLLGRFTEQFIGSNIYGESLTEHALYLGWVGLILAFVALRSWRKNRGYFAQRDNFYIGFFIFLAVLAWLFSQPPWWKIGPFKLFMPSFFMYKLLPMFRAYCRFGIVVMLAIAALAGFGLKYTLGRFKHKISRIAVGAIFCGLVLFEFWNYPPYKVIYLEKVPQVYNWLESQPSDIVIAEYPLDADSPNEMYKFFQTRHEKKMINGPLPGSYANKIALSITRLSSPRTAGVLRWLGVKYVLVHRQDYINTELIEDREELEKVPFNLGLKLIKSFPAQGCMRREMLCLEKSGPIEVYEVIAKAIKPENQ